MQTASHDKCKQCGPASAHHRLTALPDAGTDCAWRKVYSGGEKSQWAARLLPKKRPGPPGSRYSWQQLFHEISQTYFFSKLKAFVRFHHASGYSERIVLEYQNPVFLNGLGQQAFFFFQSNQRIVVIGHNVRQRNV